MRDMVDGEKKELLEDLLKQLYAKLGVEPSAEMEGAEEGMAESLSEKIGEAESEEMASEDMVEDSDLEEGAIGDFMKNRHKPKMGKGMSVMIKMATDKVKPSKKRY